MTRPIYEPNDQRAIRKGKWGINQLERRPSPIVASETNPAAMCFSELHTQTLSGTDIIAADEMWTNSADVTYSNDAGDPTTIMILLSGLYYAKFMIYWSTDFGAGTFPFIEPGCTTDGTQDNLVALDNPPAFGPVWSNTQSWIGGEQFTAAELDHHSVVADVVFNFDFTAAGLSSFGINNVLRSGFAGNKSVAAELFVMRVSDYMEEYTGGS